MANKKNSINAVEAGIVGAVVGAAIGATAAVLSDPKNRKMLGNKLNEYKNNSEKVLSDIKEKVGELSSERNAKAVVIKKALKAKQ